MKFIKKNSITILSIVFIVAVGFAAIKIYDMPIKVLKEAGVNENLAIERAVNQITDTYYAYAFSMLITFLLLFELFRRVLSNKKEEVIYVERTQDQSDQPKQESEQEQTEERMQEEIEALKASLNATKPDENPISLFLSSCCNYLEAVAGAYYQADTDAEPPCIIFTEGYAFTVPESSYLRYEFGEGLAGQVAKLGKEAIIENIPDGYLQIVSGLGSSKASNMAILPVKNEEGKLLGVLEVASFKKLSDRDLDYLRQASMILGQLTPAKA